MQFAATLRHGHTGLNRLVRLTARRPLMHQTTLFLALVSQMRADVARSSLHDMDLKALPPFVAVAGI